MDKKITDIIAEQIFDSRSNPTLKVSVYVGNITDSFSVPSGASTGKYEAFELRDDKTGKGTMVRAIEEINEVIKNALVGIDVDQQEVIDKKMIELDGTAQKVKLGGNSMIGVSIACAKTAAKINNTETYEYLRTLSDINKSRDKPLLYFNLINGGKHASSSLAFQEYHIVPQRETIENNVQICREVQIKLDEIILKKYGNLPIKGDEGGIALSVDDVIEPLNLLKEAVDGLGYTDSVMFALDVAASSFYKNNAYTFSNRDWSRDEMIELYKKITTDFPIISIEDPFDEEDYDGFSQLKAAIPNVKIIGDDLTVTNVIKLKEAVDHNCIGGIIIKPNQIGTLTETLATIKLARLDNIDCIVSHRSGETMDDFIADLAYAFGCFGIKAGALGPKERNVKYDRLIKISK